MTRSKKVGVPSQADRALVLGIIFEIPFSPAWRKAMDLAMDVFENSRTTSDVDCARCQGTGYVAQPAGTTFREAALCYGCAGKGWQTPKDVRRNKAYAIFRAKRRQTTLGL